MKPKSVDKPLHLNLYNFNALAAQDSPYVLTSPRSLQACRKAGYKPVELLYRSLQEYQDDLAAENSTQVYQLYKDQEQERLNKLEKCRAIREELMTQSGPLKENSPPLSSTDNKNKITTLITSARKEQLDKENTSRSTGKQALALKALENNQDSDLKHERIDTQYLTGETSTSDLTNNRKSTSTSASKNCSSPDIRRSKKIRTSTKYLQKIRSLPSSASSHATNRHNTKHQTLTRKQNGHDYRITTNSVSNHTSCGVSRNINAIPLKRKQVSFSYISTDNLHLSEHDRRILESMALKKKIERESDEFAYQAHQLWEQDREEREQQSSMEMAQWREIVAERRRMQNTENSRKMEEMKQSLRQSQQQLEHRIRQKEERAANLRYAVEERKMSKVEERSQSAAKRQAEAEAACQQRELEAALWQQTLDEQQKLRLERAEMTRMQNQETYRRRVASANRVEELRHQERWQQMQEETKVALQELRRLCQQREERAQEKFKQIQKDRSRQLKGQSLERSVRFQQVHQLHDDLDVGLNKWQGQVLSLQWKATQEAEVKATRHLESKRQKVENENRARWQHHTHLMDRLSRDDEARVCYIRELITRKETKMQRMAKERDMAIRESRLQAQTTADLREHIRRTLSPETFDRKVARVALEMRIAGRPPTASPPMTRSHIFLG
ncbi:coiled-coil domain-containing protein 177-like isoform X2 [Zootermopsis nevadensis]|uniref:coiled-coil domain-containing protein 177-like isoform X2 n=1 Tax=Zootermopsis nevadensis TaxID=136037 RepID=UPI000B8E43C1|nr:coiled-coil domain-containing protein 177-like isoform X2 [Zootermopsis nevadensis]